jgi:hypothetical protein
MKHAYMHVTFIIRSAKLVGGNIQARELQQMSNSSDALVHEKIHIFHVIKFALQER